MSLIKGAKHVFIAVTEVLKCYLNEGNPHKAYEIFNDHFVVDGRKKKASQPSYFWEFKTIDPVQFRPREKVTSLRPQELFHVPFESRRLVGSNRYSIPGHPSLYMANSIYTAYKELNEPEFDNLYAAMLRFEQEPLALDRQFVLFLRNKPLFEGQVISI